MHGKELRELFCACLLGDGSLTKKSNKIVYFQIGHARKQKSYLEWKTNLINDFFIRHNIDREIKVHDYNQKVAYLDKPYPVSQISFCWQKLLPALYEDCYPYYKDRQKSFKYLLEQTYSSKHLAIWFGDDGDEDRGYTKSRTNTNIKYKRSPRYRLAVCSLTSGELNLACIWFNMHFNLNPRIYFQEVKGKKYPSLRFTVKESKKIFDLVYPYFSQIPAMRYKFRWSFERYEIDENEIHPEKDEGIVQS